MRLLFFLRILPLLLLCLFATESHAQEAGLLLGLRHETTVSQPLPYYTGTADTLSRTSYHTLLITKTDTAFTIRSYDDHLLIPRPDGFWRVGVKRSIYNRWIEDFVWAAPEDIPRTLAGIQPYNGEYCEGHRRQAILYANEHYLSLDQRSTGYCEGAAHPWFFNTLAVVPLDSTTHSGLSITEVLGEGAYKAMETATQAFFDAIEENENADTPYIQEPDAANWGIVRKAGHWMVIGRLEAAEEIHQGVFKDLKISLSAPNTIRLPIQNTIAQTTKDLLATGATDAMLAPDKTWGVTFHPHHLAIHRIPSASGKNALVVRTIPLPTDTHAVLIQWIDGAQLHRWVDAFDQTTQGL